jgi:hypothetical protein
MEGGSSVQRSVYNLFFINRPRYLDTTGYKVRRHADEMVSGVTPWGKPVDVTLHGSGCDCRMSALRLTVNFKEAGWSTSGDGRGVFVKTLVCKISSPTCISLTVFRVRD